QRLPTSCIRNLASSTRLCKLNLVTQLIRAAVASLQQASAVHGPSLNAERDPGSMQIELDDLSRPENHALLNEPLQSMYELSPPESVHALAIEQLRKPDITFWSAWEGSLLLGCGALKELDA